MSDTYTMVRAACAWAYATWRKYMASWLFLWGLFLLGFLLYVLGAFAVCLLNPLLAIPVCVFGCMAPSYIYGAFIKIGFKEHEHQRVDKSFFRYLSFGAALDIVLSRLFVFIFFVGLSCVFLPLYYALARIGLAGSWIILSVVCFYLAYALFYFYPYSVVDVHGSRRIFKTTCVYAYRMPLFVICMSFLWWLACVLTFFTAGVAGFFVLPFLTLIDVYVYEELKRA